MRHYTLLLTIGLLTLGTRLHASENVYPVAISSDHRHFVTQQGDPYLVQGDAAWSLISGATNEEAERYLEDHRQKGFNSIIVNLVEHKYRGPVNRYGESPFVIRGDFSTPNEKYFEHADWVIQKAAEKGIQVFLAPVYLGYAGGNEGWYQELLANGPEKMRGWGQFVGKRYSTFDNLVWLIGGDRNPGLARVEVDGVVQGIKEFDNRHIITAHCAPENSAVDQYSREGWLDFNTTYTYKIVHRMLKADYDRTPTQPFVLIESTYEGEHHSFPQQIRRQAYWALLSGATGQFMGSRPIWLVGSGWERAMNGPASRDMAILKSLFISRHWSQLVPDEEHVVVVGGLGRPDSLDYVTAARANDGSTVIVYFPSARRITVEMSKIAGKTVTAWWVDPASGHSVSGGTFATSGAHTFTPPRRGDWVLVLDDSSYRSIPPGRG